MLPKVDFDNLEILNRNAFFIVGLVPKKLIETFWPKLKTELEKDPTLWNKGQTIDSLFDHLQNEDLKLWVVSAGKEVCLYFITMYYEYSTMKTLQVVWASGKDLKKYLSILLDTIESFGRLNGCAAVEIIGRDGWVKPLAPFGYSKLQTVFIKELETRRLH